MTRNYIAAFKARPKEMKQSGIKGMRWGVRRSKEELRAAGPAAKESTEEKSTASSGSSEKKPSGNIQDNVESSAARYDRIAGQAKAGKASDLTEQDLKFFNARTEALAKINKLNETNPTWLKSTAQKVLQQTAQNQMQNVSDSLANKYIGDPIKAALKPLEAVKTADQQAKELAAKKIGDEIITKRADDLVKRYKDSKK